MDQDIKKDETKSLESGRIKLFENKPLVIAIKTVAALVVALLIFQLGMYVGFRKASFAFGWGDNYHRAFGGPQGGFIRDFSGRDFIDGQGTAGVIARIDGDSLVVIGRNGIEKIITITGDTSIMDGRTKIEVKDLASDDQVTVIGSPKNDGKISAKIIRVFKNGPPNGVMPERGF